MYLKVNSQELIKKLNDIDIDEYARIGNTIYFFADDGVNGKEVWKTDGTEVGTSILKNINPTSVLL